ncbi:succinate dehydrogenase assembly factor 4, mitochondrial [Xiphias gladius]|uniref:succinate dehydrogenase assembly factor 4, mitochondrial n=1 Tax=Xiphias gladius TaxID=8245 RepID=UPI001A9946E5|nr:succinate dehydrogenase assembly factor 4, mitochondrial [Xiphias gladius]
MSVLRCLCASTRRHIVSSSLTVDRVFTGCSRAAGGAATDKEPLKKAKTPQGRFDSTEEKSRDVLEKFPDDVNPVTKEKGGPRGPEPTRYGDWERKGRCVDF